MLLSSGKSVIVAIFGATLAASAALADHKDWRAHEVYGEPSSPCARSRESQACHQWLREHHLRHGPNHHHHHFHGDAKG